MYIFNNEIHMSHEVLGKKTNEKIYIYIYTHIHAFFLFFLSTS